MSKTISDSIDKIRQNSTAFSSNIYNVVQLDVDATIVRLEITHNCMFLLQPHPGFSRLYYAGDSDILAEKFKNFSFAETVPIVADIITRDTDCLVFKDTEFKRYQTLMRLSMGKVITAPTSIDTVQFVGERQLSNIETLLLQEFDILVDRIPCREVINRALENRQILTIMDKNLVCGFLWYETKGQSSTIRYWCVAPAYRDQKVGSRLLKAYLAHCSASRRHVLWVKADNTNAMVRYTHYGYEPDGTNDLIYCMR